MCSCPMLAQMHANFVRKFKVKPNPEAEESDSGLLNTPVKSVSSDANYQEEAFHDGRNAEIRGSPTASCSQSPNGGKDDSLLNGIGFEILDEESQTPVPVYELMSESELNAELAKYGHGPMGRRPAIRLLVRIFDATHPVISENTPIPRKIARTFAASKQLEENRNQLNRQKASKAKIAQLIGGNGNKNSPMDVDVQLVTFGKENQEELKNGPALRQTFLDWVRKPGNEKVYNDLLIQCPVFLDNLYTSFKQDMKDVKASRETFAELLDKLGVTHCSRNLLENQ